MATSTVNMHEAKTHLSKLVAKAQQGEETIIALAGKPVARLVPIEYGKAKSGKRGVRRLGVLEGLGYTVPDDIKTPYKKEIEEMFYGNPNKLKDR